MIVEQAADGRYLIFWVGKCLKTGRELTFKSTSPFWPASFEAMRDWVAQSHRDLELVEFRPWDSVADAKRILYRVPIQHVQFGITKLELDAPDPVRKSYSLFTSRSLIGAGSSLLKGVS